MFLDALAHLFKRTTQIFRLIQRVAGHGPSPAWQSCIHVEFECRCQELMTVSPWKHLTIGHCKQFKRLGDLFSQDDGLRRIKKRSELTVRVGMGLET